MKKIFTLFALMAIGFMASAQMRTVYVYIPGDGEHQFGLSVSPTYGAQRLSVTAKNYSDYNAEAYLVDGKVTNNIGFNAGLFYGYETLHGKTLEHGNHSTLYYGLIPFGGDITVNQDGTNKSYNLQYIAQHVFVHTNSFLTYRINEQITVSGGIGLGVDISLPSKVNVDGKPVDRANNSSDPWEGSLFGELLNMEFTFDVSAGMKYWLTDEWFLGASLQYCFYTLNMEKIVNDGDPTKWNYNGAISFDPVKNTATCNYYYPKSTLQLVFSIGYTW